MMIITNKFTTTQLYQQNYNDNNELPFYSHASNIDETIKTLAPLKINVRLFIGHVIKGWRNFV